MSNNLFGKPTNVVELEVPSDLRGDTILDEFVRCVKNMEGVYHLEGGLCGKYFKNPSHVLLPGKRYKVSVVPILADHVTSVQCIEFLNENNASLVGAQGAALAFLEKKEIFPEGSFVLSFDTEDRLQKIGSGKESVPFTRVPRFRRGVAGALGFYLSVWGHLWTRDHYLLMYQEIF